LTGSFTSEGTRAKGALDDYFSLEEINLLLKHSGEKCLNDATDRGLIMRAGNFFALSGQFRLLIETLCNRMLNDPKIQDEDKACFYQELRAFYSRYLAGRTHVVDILESNGELQIRAVCHDMLEVFAYFALINAGSHREAWSTIDRLGIIPQTQSDVGAKKERYKGMDPLLARQVPMILLYAMHSLQCEHSRLKREVQPARENSMMTVLQDLKEMGRVILTFAGLVISEDFVKIAEMTRLEASMI
jgi:Nup93/Nic96